MRIAPVLLVLLVSACSSGGSRAQDPGMDPGRSDETEVAPDPFPGDVPEDAPRTDLDPGVEPADATDVPDAPDAPPLDPGPGDPGPDVLPPPPPSCCRTALDCGTDAPACVPPTGSGPSPYGVCAARPEAGRCWTDLDCGIGQACRGAGLCPCQVDCDMAYAGTGVCAPVGSACAPLSESWVLETCDAASVVLFDGTKCVGTCPGCCNCEPFCDLTFETMEACRGACETAPAECSPWGVSLMEGPFDLVFDDAPPGACERAVPSVSPCRSDADCTGTAPGGRLGEICVFGSCVDCATTVDCPEGTLCDQGRCRRVDDDACPAPVHPDAPAGCNHVRLSGYPCAVLVCDTTFDVVCNDDEWCLDVSDHAFQRCVNNRCAFCRSDADCLLDPGAVCVTPGVCLRPDPRGSDLYGAWLLRSPGAKDAGYLRFEFDGSLRHARFDGTDAVADTIPALPCADPLSALAQTGSWEAMTTGTGVLGIRLALNLYCAPRDGWRADWQVAFDPADPRHATFRDLGTLAEYDGRKVSPATCDPDFARCPAPVAK